MDKQYLIVGSDKALEYDFSTKDTAQYNVEHTEQEFLSEIPSVSYINTQYASQTNIPISVFQQKLTPFQALVKYLREHAQITNKEISELLGRDIRTIWATYKAIEKKKLKLIISKEGEMLIPVSVFNKKLSIFEALVFYLKSLDKKYSEISQLVKKDQRTIWTIYSRANKKMKEEIEEIEVRERKSGERKIREREAREREAKEREAKEIKSREKDE